jgi:hypothetical protein
MSGNYSQMHIRYDKATGLRNWIAANPCPPDEPGAACINVWIMRAAGAAHARGCPADAAIDLIRSAMTRREKQANEVGRAVSRKYGYVLAPTDGQSREAREQKAEYAFSPEALAEFTSHVDVEVTEEWLSDASPVKDLESLSPAGFLDHLYEPGESVAVVDSTFAKISAIWRRGNRSNSLDRFKKGRQGVWYLAQPVTGTEINGSYRSKANVTRWLYLVLESDDVEDSTWRKVLVQLDWPIAAIYESGKRGCHALVRVDAGNESEWERLAEEVRAKLVPLGACEGSLTSVRLTRLPNCMRGETGRLQKLLYLNPNPKKEPILFRPMF